MYRVLTDMSTEHGTEVDYAKLGYSFSGYSNSRCLVWICRGRGDGGMDSQGSVCPVSYPVRRVPYSRTQTAAGLGDVTGDWTGKGNCEGTRRQGCRMEIRFVMD